MFTGKRGKPGPGDELWTEEDQELALAWQAIKADACPGCGEPMSESFDPANEGKYEVHRHRCFACEVKEIAYEALAEDETAEKQGLFTTVRRRLK